MEWAGTFVYKYYLHKYISKYILLFMQGRTRLLRVGEVQEEAATIDSERPAASCHDLVAVKLRPVLGQQRIFMNSSGVTFKTGHVPYLLWTSVLCLVILTACLWALIVFVRGRDFFVIIIFSLTTTTYATPVRLRPKQKGGGLARCPWRDSLKKCHAREEWGQQETNRVVDARDN